MAFDRISVEHEAGAHPEHLLGQESLVRTIRRYGEQRDPVPDGFPGQRGATMADCETCSLERVAVWHPRLDAQPRVSPFGTADRVGAFGRSGDEHDLHVNHRPTP